MNNPETDPEGKYHIEMCLPVRPLKDSHIDGP